MGPEVHRQLWVMIKECSFATLVTLEESGCLRAWPLACSQQEFDGDLWFFVANDSPAMASIEANPEVCLVYGYSSQADLVSVSGPGFVVTNIAKKQQLWNPIVQAWFPQGASSGNVVLVRVTVNHAEYWDARSNKLVHLSRKAQAAKTPSALVDIAHTAQHEFTL
jgi:general stress protein 26